MAILGVFKNVYRVTWKWKFKEKMMKANFINEISCLDLHRKISILRDVDERNNKITSTLLLNATEQFDSGLFTCQVII
jgi:hypothetical protein